MILGKMIVKAAEWVLLALFAASMMTLMVVWVYSAWVKRGIVKPVGQSNPWEFHWRATVPVGQCVNHEFVVLAPKAAAIDRGWVKDAPRNCKLCGLMEER